MKNRNRLLKKQMFVLATLLFALFGLFQIALAYQVKIINVDTEAGDFFGASVDVDSDTMVIGALFEDEKANNAGAAYVYVRNENIWTFQQKLMADDGALNDQLGFVVAIDGDTIVVGAIRKDDVPNNLENIGAVYVFTRVGDVWRQQAKLMADEPAAKDLFGYSVDIDQDTIIVGAPSFDARASEDPTTSPGYAYIFERDGDRWKQTAKLSARDAEAGALFGRSVALHGDKSVVGASKDSQKGRNAGAAYVFVRTGSNWRQQTKLTADDAAPGDLMGESVSILGDTVVVTAWHEDDGGSNSGAAYVFLQDGFRWEQQARLKADDPEEDDRLGFRVSLTEDRVFIGAHREDENGVDAGAAYVFARNGITWTQELKLVAPDGEAGDNFGIGVAISGDTLVIGSELDDDVGENSGSVYVTTLGDPIVAFTAKPAQGAIPLVVSFSDASTAAEGLSGWEWDFGDGLTSREQNPIHAYNKIGIYTVTLTVSDAYDTTAKTQESFIEAQAPLPFEATFQGYPTIGDAPLTVIFTDTSTSPNGIDKWQWNFGDGGVSTEQNPTYVFENSDSYTVSLTITSPNKTELTRVADYIMVTQDSDLHVPIIVSLQLSKLSGAVHWSELLIWLAKNS